MRVKAHKPTTINRAFCEEVRYVLHYARIHLNQTTNLSVGVQSQVPPPDRASTLKKGSLKELGDHRHINNCTSSHRYTTPIYYIHDGLCS